ncbi:MAG: hypothetical protein U0165_02710 [Polyangiaceae bacterium]
MQDIKNFLFLSSFEVIRWAPTFLMPVDLLVVSNLANRVLAKVLLVREFALVDYRRASGAASGERPRSRCRAIRPCRNEKGNIRAAVARTPRMGPKTEPIFVDGNQTMVREKRSSR